MRLKHLVPVALLAAAGLVLTGCGDISDHVKTGRLNDSEKSVVETWYNASDRAEKKRLSQLSETEVYAAVSALRLLCVLPEGRITAELAKDPNKLGKSGARKLADSIERNLCHHGKPNASKTPSPSPSNRTTGPDRNASAKPVVPPRDNATHDLAEPTSRHDREEATLRAPANREPAWTHTDTGAGSKPAAKAPASPKPVAKFAPAPRTMVKSSR